MNDSIVPTKKITLPTTGHVVELKETLGTSAVRKLQKILFGSGIKLTPGQAQQPQQPTEVDGKQAVMWFDMQEEALRVACVAIYKQEENQQLTALTFVDPVEFIGDLPMSDGSIVYEEISNLINTSMMTNDAKKN